MEKIIIDFYLYKCKKGTNAKIRELLMQGEKAPAMDHGRGTAYQAYNKFLEAIVNNQNGEFIENVYRTY